MVSPLAKPETRRALQVDCPSCGMPADAACTSGRRRSSPHAARRARAAETGREREARELAEKKPHEAMACYTLRTPPDGRDCPTLECSCGHESTADTWQEAGAGMDEHLAKAGPDA